MMETEIREVLADGVVTEEQQLHLENLKRQFGMSDEQVDAIRRQVEEERAQKMANSNASRASDA